MHEPIYGQGVLPPTVRSRTIAGSNGLDVHLLEAGFEQTGRPLALLLHGFPDLAFGWRHVMPLLANAGYHVVAPDQRGFGRTTGWANDYDAPLAAFSLLNVARDAIALVSALGYGRTAMLVGHDFGSPVAAYCALVRPDIFPSLVLMSAPFPGPPAFPFDIAGDRDPPPPPAAAEAQALATGLAALDPPRMLYQHYLATREANGDLLNAPQGLRRFLRTFFHVKSGDWQGNDPHPIEPTAEAFAALPSYYVLHSGKTMPENVAPFEPSPAEIESCRWLSEAELGVYEAEYLRTGFQGGLQTYRVYTEPALNAELRLFSGRTIDVPALFIGGERDWATYIAPGALDRMATQATTQLRGVTMIEGAGHWIQQEQPARLSAALLAFMAEIGEPAGA